MRRIWQLLSWPSRLVIISLTAAFLLCLNDPASRIVLIVLAVLWPVVVYISVVWPLGASRALRRYAEKANLAYSSDGSWAGTRIWPRAYGTADGRALRIEGWVDDSGEGGGGPYGEGITRTSEIRLSLSLKAACPEGMRVFKTRLWKSAFSGCRFRVEGGNPAEVIAYLTPARRRALSKLSSMKLLSEGYPILSDSRIFCQSELFGMIGGPLGAGSIERKVLRLAQVAAALEEG